jgi:two-component system response regulator AlgR
MLNILIVDDEKPARDRLRRLLRPLSGFGVAGEAASGREALEQIRELSPDVMLLDISMPGMDGMALAKTLHGGGAMPAIIFCTAYQDQALNAFEVEAVDYLVKPVRPERLEAALEKARRYLGRDDSADRQQFLKSTVGGKMQLTPVQRVICLLAEDKYTTVIHEQGETVIEDSLTDLEGRFPSLFLRIHRNALVSRRHLRGIGRSQDGHTHALLSGTERRPEVSRRNVSSVRKMLSELG